MKENKTAYAILGLLSHESMTGYDIKKHIERSLCYFWDAGFGQIYPALSGLERKGMVTGRMEAAGRGPKRVVYTITAAGLAELRRWLERPAEKEDVRYEILLKLFFSGQCPPEQSIAAIESFRRRNESNLAHMQAFQQDLERAMGESPDHLYYYLTVLFGEKVYQAYLEWAEEAKKLLEKKAQM